MSVFIQGKTYYSLQELADLTRSDAATYIKAIKATEIDLYSFADVYHIYEKDIPTLFAELSKTRPIKTYKLPAFMTGQAEPWLGELADIYQSPDACPACLSPEQGQLLRSLALNIAPRHVVEIGTFIGVSTLWMAGALEEIGPEGRITAIDLFQDILPFPCSNFIYIDRPLDRIKARLERAGLAGRVDFHQGDSVAIGRDYARRIGRPIDLLYIDGDHTIPGCLRDFSLYEPFVAEGGYIILHDIYPQSGWDGPRHVLDTVIPTRKDLSVVEIYTRPNNFGMSIIRKLPAKHAA